MTGQRSFADLLRQARADAGLTQEELASRARLSPRTVSDLERSINLTARRETARLLADALGLADASRAEFEAAARGPIPGTATTGPQARRGGLAASFATLPRDAAGFTGRSAELGRVSDLAAGAGRAGIYAVGGMAGIGKTALAVHAAHLLAPQFPDGQIFLPLHAYSPGQQPVDPADALVSLLLLVGVGAESIPPGVDARAALWRARVAGLRLLVVLDDAAGHGQVRPLLPGSPGTLVLVTSRRHLTALEDARMISLEGLPAGDAAMMLIQLADRPDLDPGDPAVRQIVLLCGYLPLAIGMLARQLHNHPAWTCERLAADLAAARDRLSLMHAEDLSVAAAFDLSYENLDPDSRRIFRRLGLTPGSTADVHAAAALEGCDLIRARRLLVTLYDHYLLTEPAEDRYQMHDLIREHARAQADSDPVQDRDLAVRRLLGYYEHTAHQAGQLVPRRPPASDLAPAGDPPASAPALTNRQQAAAWLQTERHDLHAAVRYAATHGMPGHASGIAAAMHGFLREQSYWDQARSLHQAALDAARQAGDKQRQARALADLGDAQYTSSSYTQARSTFASALNLFRDLGDQLGQACVLSTLASAQLETGDCPAAASSQEQALELYRQAGSQIGQATALDRLGWIRTATGDYAAAASCQEQALALYRAAGDPSGEASALDGLAELHLRAGDHAAALSALSTALKLYHDIAYTLGEAVVLSNLGSAHLAAGNHKAADTALARALKLFRDLGATWGEAKTLHIMSNLYQATGDSPKAIAALTTTLEINNQLGTPLRQASTLNSLADLELSVTAVSDAHAHYNQSLAIAVTIGAPVEQARALEGIGHCHLRNDNPGQAAVLLRQAMNIYRALGSPRATLIEQKIADHEI